jgi:phenylacetic acid degradation operon negative regulatory protein
MHARSALFDVYGDLLPARDNQACVAGLVRLLGPVGISAPAVRTAISRMVTQGWLEPVSLPGGRGYAATAQAVRRLDQAAVRIYRRQPREWDGRWQLLVLDAALGRAIRSRVQRELVYLGYAELRPGVWVSPYARAELGEVLERCRTTAVVAAVDDFEPSSAPLGAWDLATLRTAYDTWLAQAADQVARHLGAHEDPDEAAFAARFHLVHEWRKFLFTDPGLPEALLPPDWPGRAASAYFAEEAGRLRAAADRFVTRALAED